MAEDNQNLDAAFQDLEVDGAEANAANGRINTIQIKIPPFWKADPELWFLQVEAQFATASIRADLSKYNHIVGKLDTDTLTAVSDIVKNPPDANKYQALKTRLTNQFMESDRQKLKTLFGDLTLNDEKPSDLLRKMKDKSCRKVADDLMQELWNNRLPQQIQAILSCSNQPLDQQVIMADKIYETMDRNSIQTLSNKKELLTNDFDSKFCQLEDKIESLHREFKRSRSRNSSSDRNRSTSRSNNFNNKKPTSYCWYHQQFKGKAKKCDKPCSFNENKSKN